MTAARQLTPLTIATASGTRSDLRKTSQYPQASGIDAVVQRDSGVSGTRAAAVNIGLSSETNPEHAIDVSPWGARVQCPTVRKVKEYRGFTGRQGEVVAKIRKMGPGPLTIAAVQKRLEVSYGTARDWLVDIEIATRGDSVRLVKRSAGWIWESA